jgi:hypothetical protein
MTLLLYGMWRRVVWQLGTRFSEEFVAWIFSYTQKMEAAGSYEVLVILRRCQRLVFIASNGRMFGEWSIGLVVGCCGNGNGSLGSTKYSAYHE